jgi:hypothetical protein
MTRRWCLMDLVVDHQTGKLRESALWSNVGKASMTAAFLWTVWKGHNSEWLWIAYGGIVIAHASVERVLNQRQQTLNGDATTTTTKNPD